MESNRGSLLVEYDTEQSTLEQEAAGLEEGITTQAEDGMRRVREAQRAASVVEKDSSSAG